MLTWDYEPRGAWSARLPDRQYTIRVLNDGTFEAEAWVWTGEQPDVPPTVWPTLALAQAACERMEADAVR